MHNELKGKRVLVTGASVGIGAAIAEAYGRCGCRVLVHFRSHAIEAEQTAATITCSGGQATIFEADLREESAIESMFSFLDKTWDGIDILVNNAGVVHKGSVLATASAEWDDTLATNLRAPYLASRCAGRRMTEQTAGTIINISSIHGSRSAENFSAYAVSKAGLESLTRALAVEWAPFGIRVNAVAPGVVPVERSREYLAETAEDWLPYIPLGRFGTPEEIAQLVVFLSGSSASWITGQVYGCDGGVLARIHLPNRRP